MNKFFLHNEKLSTLLFKPRYVHTHIIIHFIYRTLTFVGFLCDLFHPFPLILCSIFKFSTREHVVTEGNSGSDDENSI